MNGRHGWFVVYVFPVKHCFPSLHFSIHIHFACTPRSRFFSLRKRLKWNWSRFQIRSKSHEISLFFTRWNIITFDTIRKNFNRYPNELRKRIEICPLTKLFRSSNMRQGQSHRHDSNQRSENTQHRRSFVVSCNVNEITKLSKCSDERVQHPASKQWHEITRNIRSTFPSGEPVAR